MRLERRGVAWRRRRTPAPGPALLSALVLLLCLGCAPTPTAPSPPAAVAAESRVLLEMARATILHHPDDKELATTVAQALELAHRSVGESLGYPTGSVQVYIHRSREEMVNGMATTLGYERGTAEVLATVGISPVTRHKLHLRADRKWGRIFLWHAVVHEYAHGVIEDAYGMTVASSARWVYEGLGEYEAHRALKTRFPDFEERWKRWRLDVASRALRDGKWLPLAGLGAEAQWYANIEKGRETWDLQYAQAYATVTCVIEQHGFERLKAVLEAIKEGHSLEQAIERALGVSPAQLEAGCRAFVMQTRQRAGARQ